MPADAPRVPETRVLAIASHVVSGHVGNKIAVFAMQALGCDVAALNTVQFSNHTGYRQVRGTKTSAAEIWDLYEGLQQSYLDNFDMMLSGYVPGAAAVEVVGRIAKELRARAEEEHSPGGSFFWVLDPVMGDNGKLYVADDVVPAYKQLLHHADLILPNQFEAELLSDVKITSMETLHAAIQVLHERFHVPHVVITSVSLASPDHPEASLSVVGSSRTSAGKARAFKIVFPAIDCYFSGTGDMFGALMVVRMREDVAAQEARDAGSSEQRLSSRRAWLSDDAVAAVDLPLARAAEKVLASMHEVLSKTCEAMPAAMARANAQLDRQGVVEPEARAKALHLLKSGAAELRLPRNVNSLRAPQIEFRAVALEFN